MALLFKVVNSSFMYFNASAAALLVATSLIARGQSLDANTKHYMAFKHAQLPKEANVSLDKTFEKLKKSIPVGVLLRLSQTATTGVLAGFWAGVIVITSANAEVGRA